jgi:dihydrofolate reductase
MTGDLFVAGYAIVSADGMIADRDRHMPGGLKVEADARFFTNALDAAALIVHGRHSHEQQPASNRRLRLVVTSQVASLEDHPELPRARLWNPNGMSFAEAAGKMGVRSGLVAVTGGARVFDLFLQIGFDAFHLSCANKVRLPGGRPVFPRVPELTPEQVLMDGGLRPGPVQVLDDALQVSLVTWTPAQGS